MDTKPDSQNIGNAGEYFFAFILSAHGFTSTITLGRAETFDILAVNPNGKPVKISVKTRWGKVNSWPLSDKCDDLVAPDLFYAFVRLNEMKEPPEFWVFPSSFIAPLISQSNQNWLKTPGKNGQKHNESSVRQFFVTGEKYWPKNISMKTIEDAKNNIKPLL
jgi:hypothetical protein